jgi:hypothetical protein
VDEEKASPRTVKVVDRRKFTSDGEPRGESETPRDRPSEGIDHHEEHKAPAAEPGPTARKHDTADHQSVTSQYFIGLVESLAHQAAILLTGVEGQPAQPAEAKKVIDYLGMLEEKTTGNLTPEEKRFLGDVMFELRSAYLKST